MDLGEQMIQTNGIGVTRRSRLKAYGKLLRGLLMVCSAIYELAFGEAPPKVSDVLGNRY